MASPFRYFRKHTKAFMAVAAVLAIFIFVVGDALMGSRNYGNGGRDAGAVVATWEGETLTEADLASLIQQRRITNEFLLRLFGQGGGRSEYDWPQSLPQLLLRGNQEVESQVVETEVLADLAEDAGVTVSDAMINRYIEGVGLNQVGGDQIVGILNSFGNARQTEAVVFSTLRKLLAADFYRRMYADAAFVVLPQQKFDDWRKVNERVSLQVASIPTEKFLDNVSEPTEAQLQAFYNDYKEAEPGRMENVGGRELPAPTPGFAIPHRVKLQYLLGNIDAKAQELLDTVTDAEIAQYYEEHREEFLKMDFSLDATPAEEPATDQVDAAEGAAPVPGEGAADADAGEPGAETGEVAPPAEPADNAEPHAQPETDEAQPAGPAGDANTPSDEPADNAAPAEDEAAPAADEPVVSEEPADSVPDNTNSSSAIRKSPFQLVAYQAAPEGAEEEAAVEEDAAGEPAAAGEEPAQTDQPEDQPAAPGNEAVAGEEPGLAAPETATAPTETPEGDDQAAAESTATQAEPATEADEAARYEPLENVRDEIRQAVARNKAQEQLGRTMAEAVSALESEYNRWGIRVAEAKEADRQPPAPPTKLTDLTWLAEQYDLTYEKMTELTARGLFDTAVGKATDAVSGRQYVTQAAFTSLAEYQPYLGKDEGSYYLVQKIEDKPRRVPEYKQVRDQVAEAWKRQQAAKLAEAEATKLAEEIEKTNTPFDQFFFADRGYDVTNQTQFFSWRSYPPTGPGAGRPPELSEVPELKNVGPEFMETAFSLTGNEAKSVMNYDDSVAYVVRLARRQWSDDELRQLFLEEQAAWPGQLDMMLEHYTQFSSAVEREMLMERANFQWNEEYLERRREQGAQRDG